MMTTTMVMTINPIETSDIRKRRNRNRRTRVQVAAFDNRGIEQNEHVTTSFALNAHSLRQARAKHGHTRS